MKRWKFVLSVGLVAVLVLCLPVLSGCSEEEDKYPEPTEAFYVNDYADILSAETEQIVLNKGVALAEKTKAQIVVLTISSMNGEDIETYALNLGREWGIGDEEEDTGVLLLVALEEREARIEVGYGLEGAITATQAGQFLDNYAVPYFENDDFDTGVRETYEALINEVYLEFGLEAEVDPDYVPIDEVQAEDDLDPITMLILLGVVLAFVGIFTMLSVVGRRRGWPIFINMGGFHHHHGGFGGFGGGSFRGGGGGFGGGGASRGF